MQILATVVFLLVLAWLWSRAYRSFLASWFPHRASETWRTHVNGLNGQFSAVFKWTSPLLLVCFSLLILLNAVRLALEIWQRLAS
jgi:hypothetical protein